ncbi:MAG: hypothetical protein JRI25_16460 [Deltaproteobacteria bacterium]|nr:hypothetical protein [Deltaproteobacteria bacterium]
MALHPPGAHRWHPAAWALLALTLANAAVGGDGDGYREVAAITDGLREPCAVAVLEGGSIAVADFGADTVSLFEADGTTRWVAHAGLDHPTGLGADSDVVWVADAGNHRLVALAASDGAVTATVALSPDFHPTDVAVTPSGLLWVSAAPEDIVLLVDQEGGVRVTQTTIDDLPLRAPRGLATDREGGVYFADALQGRVVHLDSGGRHLATLGGWGLREGQFVKPKDVALLDSGELAVLDTHQGVIQVLGASGEFVRLVSGPNGPHEFTYALGLAADGGRLIVADTGKSKVAVLQRGGPAFEDGRFPEPQTLFRRDSMRDDDLTLICRNCHDGSRRMSVGNWDPAVQNHPLEVEGAFLPPANVELTPEGNLRCISCHVLHLADAEHDATQHILDFGLEERASMEKPVRLGVCMDCHGDYVDNSPQHRRTSHPVGLDPPAGANLALLESFDATLEDGSIGCRTCHTPHGATLDHLLVAPYRDGTLCLTCHAEHAPGSSVHPVQMVVDHAVRVDVASFGGVLTEDGRLTCLSCHDPHQATAATLLRTRGAGAAACRVCHEPETEAHAGGGHEPVDCVTCHGMHAPATRPAGAHLAGVGPQVCLDCHTSAGAERRISLARTHPVRQSLLPDGCESCHDRHAANLVTSTECGACHEVQLADLERGGHGDTGCPDCHPSHDDPPAVGGLAADVNPFSARCLACHSTTADSGETSRVSDYEHPVPVFTPGGQRWQPLGDIPLFDTSGKQVPAGVNGDLTCGSCHRTHGPDPDEPADELRRPGWKTPCAACHGESTLAYYLYFHQPERRETD